MVDRLLEPQTIAHFLGFALGQPLPDGTRPVSIGSLTPDEVSLLQSSPPGQDSKTIMDHVMSRIGSTEDPDRLCIVGKNIQSLKSRLWEGITPLSDQRWQEKGLHLDESFPLACQQLSSVLAVFEYLNQQQVRDHLRDTFNLIHGHWQTLDTQLAEKRAQTGADPISVADLWPIYMASHNKVMTQNAHHWVTKHVDALRAPLMQGLLDHQSTNEGTGVPDATQWKLMDGLHMLLEISVRSDYCIMIPMDGYKGYTVPPPGSGPAEMYVADLAERGKAYSQRVKTLSHQIMFQKMMFGHLSGGAPTQTSGESYHESAMEQIEAQTQVRQELRGVSSESIPQEPWITGALESIRLAEKNHTPTDRGIAIYRLTHEQSESEWSEFVEKLETHISNWGQGQPGSDSIKPHLKLHWIDGKELGLAEGDIEAVKKHFNELVDPDEKNDHDSETESQESTSLPLTLQKNVFLAIDSASFASYTTETYKAIVPEFDPSDFAGFVLAVDPSFDPQEGPSRPDESPGYNGHMRVLGGLVWGDLYALLESQSASLEDLWPLARHHPNQVYVGPPVPLQVYGWQSQNAFRWNFLREALKYAKRAVGF
ncbi:hypothetical protein F1880_006588 [Penicillium rolfsii]|nr:hypothetical protein F1880_006588 [Penicillium rolfsii]